MLILQGNRSRIKLRGVNCRIETLSKYCAEMDSKPETKSIGLTKAAQDMIGSRLLEMGYRIVDITFDAETGKPDVSEDVVDCIYFSPDFFGYFLSGNREERQIIGRDVIVPKARSWIHVPSAGLDAWYSILENMKLRTSDEDNSEGVKLTHAPGVSGAAMAEYVVAHMLSIAKKIPEHAAIQKERKWQKISQKAMDRATLGILGCGGIGLQTARCMYNFFVLSVLSSSMMAIKYITNLPHNCHS